MRIISLLFFLSMNFLCFAGFKQVSHLIAPYLPKDPVIVEAGAHDGSDTYDMAYYWRDARIHAFEPVQFLFKRLCSRVTHCSNVTPHQCALWSSNGKRIFNVSGHDGYADGSGSLRVPKEHLHYHPGVNFATTEQVDVVTLDAWAEQEAVQKVDFLWLDMQGCEYETLVASPRILKTVKVVYTEVNFIELYEGCVLYPEYKAWLESNGFTEIYRNFHPDAGNALFVRK